jgi:hypothetical protein
MRYAIYETVTGLIVNICIWDGEAYWHPGEGLDVVALGDSGAGIGWTYINGTFTPPTE